MTAYSGMRWFKCDFQVQTPEFAGDWLDPSLALAIPRRRLVDGRPDESDIQEKARVFLRRCHELELDVIAITDHNFSAHTDHRDWFLTHLIEQNRSVASELGRAPICIFPGFEIDIGYHLVCLFEPVNKGSKLSNVSDVLTTLGLAPNARFVAGRPAPLRHDNRDVALAVVLRKVQAEKTGLVIGAHAFSTDGICSDARNIADFKNDELLCVEVPAYPLSAKCRNILSGADPQWARGRRKAAYVMSSDAKSLHCDEDGEPQPNCLGYRHTWVKMSTPSIEALRQAFLDGDSRISLSDPIQHRQSPDATQTYPRIASLSVKNLRFLADQSCEFSKNLNCIIGGRGSGKSTLLECLRFGLGRADIESAAKSKVDRIRRTFSDDTEIVVEWQSGTAEPERVTFRSNELLGDGWDWAGRTSEEVRAFLAQLPVQIFSQGELTDITASDGVGGNHLLSLIDGLHVTDLQALRSKIGLVRGDVLKLFASRDQEAELKKELQRLSLEAQELDRQWQARKDLQIEAQAHQQAQLTERYLRDVCQKGSEMLASANQAAELLGGDEVLPSLPDALRQGLDAAWLEGVQTDLEVWRADLQSELGSVLQRARQKLDALTVGRPQWSEVEKRLAAAQGAFFAACQAKGLQPQDVSRLQELDRQRQSKAREIGEKQKQLTGVQTQISALKSKQSELTSAWKDLYSLRLATIERLNKRTAPAVKAAVTYMGDQQQFAGLWSRLAPDRRTRLGRVWEEIGIAFFQWHCAEQGITAIWDRFRQWVIDELKSDQLATYQDYRQEITEHIKGPMLSAWREISTTRVEDAVDITLSRRVTGERIGSVGSGELSEGQRNTAVLTLLLAEGTGPVVIDQPEDEVDSNFLYEDLVPVLREIKNQRQLIFVTHNANIPVNADAELIYALEARGGRGVVRVQGGLDTEGLTQAVLEVMEGSDEAFRRRGEKYNF